MEQDPQSRPKGRVWAPVVLALAVLVAGAVVFAATRDPGTSYESPLTILEIMEGEGYDCPIEPDGRIVLGDDKDTILCVPSASPQEGAAIQTFVDTSDVDSEVRLAEDITPAADEKRTWIVGENWIVKVPRSSASNSELTGMANVLEGEIFVP